MKQNYDTHYINFTLTSKVKIQEKIAKQKQISNKKRQNDHIKLSKEYPTKKKCHNTGKK